MKKLKLLFVIVMAIIILTALILLEYYDPQRVLSMVLGAMLGSAITIILTDWNEFFNP